MALDESVLDEIVDENYRKPKHRLDVGCNEFSSKTEVTDLVYLFSQHESNE